MWGQMPKFNYVDYVPIEDRGITPCIFEQLFSRIQQVDQLILQKETIQNDVLYMSQNKCRNVATHNPNHFAMLFSFSFVAWL
jgi:hypothetical protein